MNYWFGTTNKGKLSELKILFEKELPGAQIHSIAEIPSYFAPPENGKTFLENARIKARSLKAMKPGEWVFAEDSGLEVVGMGGLPGIHSARYAGPKASDSENISKLIKMMQLKGVMDRSAHFLCQMAVFTPQGEEWLFEGKMSGTISKVPAGQHGFGYDPVFIPEGENQTLAQLGVGFKNQKSHRTQAARLWIEKMKSVSVPD